MGSDDERAALLAEILALERENRSLTGLIKSAQAKELATLRTLNEELKIKLVEAEKALAFATLDRKTPIDGLGWSERLQALKGETLAYCADKKIEPSLWKKLESL